MFQDRTKPSTLSGGGRFDELSKRIDSNKTELNNSINTTKTELNNKISTAQSTANNAKTAAANAQSTADSKLNKSDVVNSNSITTLGKALDAIQANPNVSGSIAYMLNDEINKRYNLLNPVELNINSEGENSGWVWTIGKWYNLSTKTPTLFDFYHITTHWTYGSLVRPMWIGTNQYRLTSHILLQNTAGPAVFGHALNIILDTGNFKWKIENMTYMNITNNGNLIEAYGDGTKYDGFKLFGITAKK